MEGNPMFQTRLIIADREVAAGGDRTFDRLDPVTGDVATRAAAASVSDATHAADAAAAAFPEWSAMLPGERRAVLMKAADILQSKADDFAAAVVAETGSPAHWSHFNVGARRRHDPRSGLDDHPDHRRGHPLQPAGLDGLRHPPAGRRVPGDRAVERADHPRRALGRDAAGLRQHRRLQVVRALPAHPCAHRRGVPRGGAAQGHHQPGLERAGRMPPRWSRR